MTDSCRSQVCAGSAVTIMCNWVYCIHVPGHDPLIFSFLFFILFDSVGVLWPQLSKVLKPVRWAVIVQELCESRGGRPGLSVLTSLLVSLDVKLYWTMLWHWSQLVPYMSTDIRGHKATLPTYLPAAPLFPIVPAEAGCLFTVASGVHVFITGESLHCFLVGVK